MRKKNKKISGNPLKARVVKWFKKFTTPRQWLFFLYGYKYICLETVLAFVCTEKEAFVYALWYEKPLYVHTYVLSTSRVDKCGSAVTHRRQQHFLQQQYF